MASELEYKKNVWANETVDNISKLLMKGQDWGLNPLLWNGFF